jgi:excisionase family DNA binding protein
MPKDTDYTINEVAALTGLHRNTIRMRIRTGHLQAEVRHGKFGEEYRISQRALADAGMLTSASDEDGSNEELSRSGSEKESALSQSVAALSDLYQRHEQAMFRLGYMQGELERTKALAETAESLRAENDSAQQELETLRDALAAREAEAAEAERLRRELEQTKRQLAVVEALRQELDSLKELAAKRPWWRPWG